MMKLKIIGGLIAVWFLWATSGHKNSVTSTQQQDRDNQHHIEFCILMGIKEYKELGSYPRLTTTGDLALPQIEKACNYNPALYDTVTIDQITAK